MEINTSEIERAGTTITSDIKADIDTLKSYFEDTQMLDLDGPPSKVARKIEEVTSTWSAVTGCVNSIKQAAREINNISID